MAEENETKRIISLGFQRPETLEGNIIYVDFSRGRSDGEIAANGEIAAIAYSNEKFIVERGSGGYKDRCVTSAYTRRGGEYIDYQQDHEEFIGNLVRLNNGQVDHRRLIGDGSGLVAKIVQSRELLNIRLHEG